HRRPPPATAAVPPENFSGEPQKHSSHPDLLDPRHHSPPRAATASKTTTTATTYNTTMAAAALAVIFATQPPQQHQKGEFDSYKDATGLGVCFGLAAATGFVDIENLSDAVICAFLASQPNSPQLARVDLEQIDHGDLEEMDLH
nr:hypothetical protein [Tanacetum cinerariifolium]